MSDKAKFIICACVLAVVVLAFISAMTEANRLKAQVHTFASAYQEVRVSVYIKSVCGIDGSPITEKDKSCVVGVRQRAKAEIEAMKQ